VVLGTTRILINLCSRTKMRHLTCSSCVLPPFPSLVRFSGDRDIIVLMYPISVAVLLAGKKCKFVKRFF
jgi:hypothetical protein